MLLNDAAVVVVAPFFVPDTPPTVRNPVFMHYSDGFVDPKPFEPTVVVGIDEAADKKWKCVSAMPSQFGDKDSWQGRTLPNVPAGDRERESYLLDSSRSGTSPSPTSIARSWSSLYGKERGQAIKYAEAFQLGQYGRQASLDELKRMFPPSFVRVNSPLGLPYGSLAGAPRRFRSPGSLAAARSLIAWPLGVRS